MNIYKVLFFVLVGYAGTTIIIQHRNINALENTVTDIDTNITQLDSMVKGTIQMARHLTRAVPYLKDVIDLDTKIITALNYRHSQDTIRGLLIDRNNGLDSLAKYLNF